MEMQLFPWIEADVAIEIIGKMIAEQVSLLNKYVELCRKAAYKFDSIEIKNDVVYKKYMRRIIEYKQEIDQIHRGEDIEKLYKKVNEEYAPYLRKQHIARKESKKFFNETEGFGFVKPDKNDKDIFVSASSLTNPIDDNELTTTSPKRVTQLSDTP